MTKNTTAKTLTLTAKKAPRKAAAPLVVPKTATSYVLEGEAAATVTVVKTRSRLVMARVAPSAESDVEPVAESAVESAVDSDTATTDVAAAAAPTVVRKRVSKLAAVKTAEAEQAAAVAVAPKVGKPRVARKLPDVEPTVIQTAGQAVSQVTDAATLAAIDTSGYLLPSVKVPGRRGIDLISTLPVAIPGLVIGVAYLWAWIGVPGGLYGTIWILALAFIARFLPDTVKALSTSLMQIHRELEEAAWICGRDTLSTVRTIVLPLARPGVVAAMTLLFILAVRELGSSLFLYSSDSMVMAVLLLDYYDGGNISITAAFSLVQMVLLAVLIGIAHYLSRGSADSGIGKAG